ncbi:proline--tRNA ligase [Oxyplasma meridianum]|uniref:Proline--tRNA ligase n=1 Tax=Oxyplasma meridianum TaxID=3073602 RepID=A0AAX4NF06_9ARCH
MENKKDNFSEWYNEIIEISGLSDKRYPVKGMNVWMPYGLKAMQFIDNLTRKYVDAMDFQEVSFPVLITRGQLMVEFEHVKGFENELFWITKGGSEKLEEDMAMRPTSEAAMYPMFALWIRSHADLPMKIYQIVNVYRYETKHTRSFIRIREIHFFEAHTAHATYEDAEKQMDEYLIIWKKLTEMLCLPYLVNQRPDWDKFPGAKYTLAFDTVMPSGRALQIGTIHQYGTNFSKNYNITYALEDGSHELVSQTTFGMSERLLAAIISIHGDDTGLIFPPDIAPVQIIIVPIPSRKVDVEAYSYKILENLREMDFRVKMDDRDAYTPGYKYNDWEMRGVPLRIEIGAREVEKSRVTVSLRTEKEKMNMEKDEFFANIHSLLSTVKKTLTERSIDTMKKMTINAENIDEIKGLERIAKLFWCGSEECSRKIEEQTEMSCLGMNHDSKDKGKCIVCGKDGFTAIFARTY